MDKNKNKLLSLERGEHREHLAITKNPPFIEWILNGRDDRIRTCDPLVPSEVRYQAALHPERGLAISANSNLPTTNFKVNRLT